MNYWITTAFIDIVQKTERDVPVVKVRIPLSQIEGGKVSGWVRVNRLPDDLQRFTQMLMRAKPGGLWLRRVRVRTPSGASVEHTYSIEGDDGDPIAVVQSLLYLIVQELGKA